jgi:hypothetical protein
MPSKKLDIRFIVGALGGAHSSIWRAWSQKNDVYAGYRSLAGVEKISFHRSGVCRKAFTKEFGAPKGLDDRLTQRWRRAPTPVQGEGKGSLVLTIAFPTDYLSTTELSTPSKPLLPIPAAPTGHARCVDLFFTRESEENVIRLFGQNSRSLHVYVELPSGEAFAIASYATEWRGNPVKVPASQHEESDLVFHRADPDETGRPIRLTMFSSPGDNDPLFCQELGGYRVAGNDPRFLPWPFDTLSRDRVFAKSNSGVEAPPVLAGRRSADV